jgi:hypothetical protein
MPLGSYIDICFQTSEFIFFKNHRVEWRHRTMFAGPPNSSLQNLMRTLGWLVRNLESHGAPSAETCNATSHYPLRGLCNVPGP